MAHRAFLVQAYLDDPNVTYDDDNEAIVAAANYIFPVLWCAAFGPADIAWRSLHETAGEDEEDGMPQQTYPVLLAPSSLVRQRARQRRAVFFGVFPHTLERVYDEWLTLLDGVDRPYLFIDALELWELSGTEEPAEREADLIECVSPFENGDPRAWSALLEQANIAFDPATADVSFDEAEIPYVLRGYKWLRPVPWTE